MKEKLISLLSKSYSPYSNYPVAAILITKDLKEFSGVNVENASYGATICAERNAIFSAVTAGYKKNDFKELYVMVKGEIATPCSICRQVMTEFFEDDMNIICMNELGSERIYKVSDLIPSPFNEDSLK